MKKIFLGLLLVAGTSVVASANNLTVINLTGCDYTLSISGTAGNYPNAMVAANSSQIFSSSGSLNIGGIKIMYVSGTNHTQVNVDYGSPYSNSIGQPTPPCLTNTFFTASWAQSSPTADATVVIF